MMISKLLGAAVLAATLAGSFGVSAASAETWSQAHPRRAEVNQRLVNQYHRINVERREGLISGARARALHRQDRFVGAEERFMAAQHNGHVTRAEMKSLNQQENGVSRKIAQ